MTINVALTLREPCPKADLTSPETIGELGELVIHLEADLAVCEKRRAGLVDLIDSYNAISKPKPWWKKLIQPMSPQF